MLPRWERSLRAAILQITAGETSPSNPLFVGDSFVAGVARIGKESMGFCPRYGKANLLRPSDPRLRRHTRIGSAPAAASISVPSSGVTNN